MFTIVLDTNVLIGAFLTPTGENSAVLQRAKGHKLCLSPFILSEIWRTLRLPRIRKKYSYSDGDLIQYVQYLRFISRIHTSKRRVRVCSDADDNHVLACAVEARAEYLVTRNVKHFPSKYRGVSVITPERFLQIVRQR